MRREIRWAPLLTLALFLALAGCARLGGLKDEFDPRLSTPDKAYQEAIEPYRVKASIHGGPATELMATALPLTATVRRAMVERQANAQALPEAGRQALMDQQAADLARGLEVVISVYVPETRWNDLAGAKPDWEVFIQQAGGARFKPLDTRRLKDRSALAEALYPFWGAWDRLYRLRFAPQAAQAGASLVISGAPGRVDMPLKLD